MKNVKATININLLADDVLAELASAIESYVSDSLSSAVPDDLRNYMSDFLDTVEQQVQAELDTFMETDLKLDSGDYLDQPEDCTSVDVYYENSCQEFRVTMDVDMEDRDEPAVEGDFNRLVEVLHDIGLNMADKTAILKIAADAGVK